MTKIRTTRSCPQCLSSVVPGKTKRGQDGKLWTSTLLNNNSYRWMKKSTKKKPAPARPSQARGYWDVRGVPSSMSRFLGNSNDDFLLKKHKSQFSTCAARKAEVPANGDMSHAKAYLRSFGPTGPSAHGALKICPNASHPYLSWNSKDHQFCCSSKPDDSHHFGQYLDRMRKTGDSAPRSHGISKRDVAAARGVYRNYLKNKY